MQLSGCLFVHHDVTSAVELDIISWEKTADAFSPGKRLADFNVASCQGTICTRTWPWNQIGSYRLQETTQQGGKTVLHIKGWDGQGCSLRWGIQVGHLSHSWFHILFCLCNYGWWTLPDLHMHKKISMFHMISISSLCSHGCHGMCSLLNSIQFIVYQYLHHPYSKCCRSCTVCVEESQLFSPQSATLIKQASGIGKVCGRCPET